MTASDPRNLFGGLRAGFRDRPLAALSATLFLILACWSWSLWRAHGSLRGLLAEREKEFNKLSAVVMRVEELEAGAAAVRARMNVARDLRGIQERTPGLLMDLHRAMPKGARLETLEAAASNDWRAIDVRLTLSVPREAPVARWAAVFASTAASKAQGKFLDVVIVSSPTLRGERRVSIAMRHSR